jgi:hypothetical protein
METGRWWESDRGARGTVPRELRSQNSQPRVGLLPGVSRAEGPVRIVAQRQWSGAPQTVTVTRWQGYW